ncbi:MAG TPA: PAS domain-containing protein [Microvirga sp.]|jgi:PAS domain S-box-containing protein|nr:PAS domain-containing protein [Microvirga sp.]
MSRNNDIIVSRKASEEHRTCGLSLLAAQVRSDITIPKQPCIGGATADLREPAGITQAEFNRSILEASADCIKVLTLGGHVHSMNEYGRRLIEISDIEQVKGQLWIEFWSHDQRAAVQNAINAARSGGVGRYSGYRPTAKGTPKWWDVVVTPVRGPGGTLTHLLVVSRDVTSARDRAEAGDLLTLELGHRIKNIFALINGLITLAARPDPAVEPFATTLRARFMALSRALDYVVPSKVAPVTGCATTLQGLLRVLLDPYEGVGQSNRRFLIRGDDPAVGEKATTSLALSVHELATNAVKYGALASPEGHVTITCRCHLEGECEVTWTERGGPDVAGPPEQAGFGSKLLLRSVTGALSGQVRRQWDQEGLTLHLLLPLGPLSQ